MTISELMGWGESPEYFSDPTLSGKAKGLLGLLNTYNDGDEVSAEHLSQFCRDGAASIRAGLHELEQAGRLHRVQRRNADGTLGGTTWIIGGQVPTAPVDTSGWAYAIAEQSSSSVKIGCSQDVKRRLRALQTGWPGTLEIRWQAPGGRALEAYLHDHFNDRRIRGEWFDFTGEDAAAVIAEAAAAFVHPEAGQ